MTKTQNEFRFNNNRWILLNVTHGNLKVKLLWRMRTEPYIGMKQPTPRGATLGVEARLAVLARGKPASGYRWSIRHGEELVAEGELDLNGFGYPALRWLDGSAYKLCLSEPPEASPLASSEPVCDG